MYWFKRKYQQIQRVIDFLPVIWKGFDFDYHYSIELFKKQLERQAKFMESDRAMTLDAKINAQQIRTALLLMDKVYGDGYSMEYLDIIERDYGKTNFEFVKLEDRDENGEPYYELNLRNELAVDDEHQKSIDELKAQLRHLSNDKHKRAHKLLWDFIEHNIESWWD